MRSRGERMKMVGVQDGPRRVTQSLLVLFLAGVCSRGTGFYGQTLIHAPEMWRNVLSGTATAPEQYRIGIVLPANWIAHHLSTASHTVPISTVFGAMDLVGSIMGVLLLYALLERSQVYRRATVAAQWFGSAGFVALVCYAVDWTDWYQKVGTLPSVGVLALMTWLWSARDESEPGQATAVRTVATAVALLVLVVVQSLIRADLAMMLCLGVLIATALGRGSGLAISRVATLVTSGLGVLLSLGVQWYLARVMYPHASYGQVPVLMLRYDFADLKLWASWLIFVAPVLWTAVQAARFPGWGEGLGRGVLLGALMHMALWIVVGRLDEVRIFLPMALLVLPMTLEIAMRRVELIEVTR